MPEFKSLAALRQILSTEEKQALATGKGGNPGCYRHPGDPITCDACKGGDVLTMSDVMSKEELKKLSQIFNN